MAPMGPFVFLLIRRAVIEDRFLQQETGRLRGIRPARAVPAGAGNLVRSFREAWAAIILPKKLSVIGWAGRVGRHLLFIARLHKINLECHHHHSPESHLPPRRKRRPCVLASRPNRKPSRLSASVCPAKAEPRQQRLPRPLPRPQRQLPSAHQAPVPHPRLPRRLRPHPSLHRCPPAYLLRLRIKGFPLQVLPRCRHRFLFPGLLRFPCQQRLPVRVPARKPPRRDRPRWSVGPFPEHQHRNLFPAQRRFPVLRQLRRTRSK